jgi:hypothetical protein
MDEISVDVSKGIEDAVYEARQPDELATCLKTEFSKIVSGQLSIGNASDSTGIIERLLAEIDLSDE